MSIGKSPSNETGSTLVHPGGGFPRAPAPHLKTASLGSNAATQDSWDRVDFGSEGLPVLVTAALPLLNLAGRLRGVTEQPDLEALRTTVIQAAKLFEQKGLSGSVPLDRMRAAHYALCATIDDIVLNAPWGAYSVWARQSMVSTFHGDVTGGERFFDLLAHLHKDPGTNCDVLLLMYYCLSIGFEGRMRVHSQGHLEIGRIREGLYRTLRRDAERELSPQWRGADMRHRPLSTLTIIWTAAAAALAFLLAVYFGLYAALDRRSDATFSMLLDAPPHSLPTLERITIPRAPAPAGTPAIEPTGTSPTQSSATILKKALATEIAQGSFIVNDIDGGSRIRLKNEGLFDPGKDDIHPNFAELIDRLGRLLSGTAAHIVAVGYTDDRPIHTSKFRSNYYLSLSRAEAVAKLLSRHVDPNRIRAEGRGAIEPIASNATPEGREQNRRTEIIVADRKEP